MLKKVLRMSLSAANLAVMQGRTREKDPAETVKCSTLFVLPAASRARFLSSREMIARSIAAIALQKTEDKIQHSKFQCALRGTLFLSPKAGIIPKMSGDIMRKLLQSEFLAERFFMSINPFTIQMLLRSTIVYWNLGLLLFTDCDKL